VKAVIEGLGLDSDFANRLDRSAMHGQRGDTRYGEFAPERDDDPRGEETYPRGE
jgi:hypothetical protein